MLICRNAEGVHGKKKVGNPWARPTVPNLFLLQIHDGNCSFCSPIVRQSSTYCLCCSLTSQNLPKFQRPGRTMRSWIKVSPPNWKSSCIIRVSLSRFWVYKRHPNILQWHPKFWKPRYDFALYWSKTIWGKHIFLHLATATDGCNRSTLFFGAEIGRENCKCGICALHCAPRCFGLFLCCRRFVQYGVRKCESTLMQLWKCFTVSPIRAACLAMYQTTMKVKGRQLQRACKTR